MSETDWGQWVADTHTDQQKDTENVDNSGSSMATIDDLGEYELIKIFSYFPFKERLVFSWVCHHWRHCVEKSFKSETVLNQTTVGPKFQIPFKLFCLLIQKCHNVRHLSLTGVSVFSDNTEEVETLVKVIVSNCSQLQSMDFGSIYLDQTFKTNANYFLRLKKIISRNITEEALNCIIGSENLETIDIYRNIEIKEPDFKKLGTKMRELHLIETEVVKPTVIQYLCEGNGKGMEVLSIDIREKEVLSLICDNLIKLKELKLCLYSEKCDFKRFANFIDLKSLQIEAKESIFKSQEFTDLIRALKVTKISELTVVLSSMNNIAVTDESLQELRQSCPFIEKLVIRGANSLTGTGMYSISQMKHLKHLDLKSCLNISDQIEIVITSCPLLRQLILHSCLHITNTTVEPFIEKSKTLPEEKFFLDVIETNVLPESLPLHEELPKNLKLLYETEDCNYSDCEHGWGQDGYHSGPDEDYIDMMDDLEFYVDDDAEDYYDDYGDEDIDYEFS